MTAFDAPIIAPQVAVPDGLIASQNLATLRFASHGCLTGASDTPANTLYEARLLSDIEIEQSALDALTLGGRVALTAAQIDMWNGDGILTNLIAEGRADGRAIEIRTSPVGARNRGDWGASYSGAALNWRGRVSRIEDGGVRAKLAMTDLSDRFVTPLQPDKYDGAGGMGGTLDLKGRPKPISLGWRFNVTPIFVGQVDLGLGELPTYQTHSLAVNGHDAVRIRGVEQVKVSSAPGIGQYADFPAAGAFQLGSTPDGAVTCDVNGDASCGLVPTLAAIIRRLLTGFGASLSAEQLDPTSWFAAEPQLTGAAGWGVGADETTVTDALDQVLASAAAFLCGSRDGRIRLVVLGSPAAQPHFELNVQNCVSLDVAAPPVSLQPTPQRVDIAVARNWTVLTDIAGSIEGAPRAALSSPGSVESALSSAIAAKSVRARTWRLEGLYRYPADAMARAQALSLWLERGLRVVKVTTDRYLGQMELGLTGRVTYPFYGLQNGWSGVVVGYRERVGARRLDVTMIG